MTKKFDLYTILTDKIVAKLQEGVIPWKKPWKIEEDTLLNHNLPRNFVTKNKYRGVNVLLLSMESYTCPYWITFVQAQKLGGKITKGEKGTLIVYFKAKYKGEKVEEEGADNPEEQDTYQTLYYHRVFNLEQTNLIDEWRKDKENAQIEPREEGTYPIAEHIYNEIQNEVPIRHIDQKEAFYNVKSDFINTPSLTNHINPNEFYSTIFHEVVHATGHEDRLKREGIMGHHMYRSEKYSNEELIAELGAFFLGAIAEVGTEETEDNNASYIEGWSKALQKDNKLLVKASSKAQKAVDWILEKTGVEEE